MAAGKQARTRREIEQLHARQLKRLDLIGAVLQTLVPWTAIVLIVWLGSDAVRALAGQSTFADIGIKFLADVRVSDAVGYILGGGGLMYGYKQQQLKQKTLERLSGRIAQLEREKDPARSSSRLTEKGTTRPEDRNT